MSSHPAPITSDADVTSKGRSVLRATAVTVAAALAVNLVIWAIASAISDVPDRFTPLQPGSVAFLTIIGVAAAGGLFAILRSRVSEPAATFRRLVPVALVISLVPDILIWANRAYEGAAKAETVLPLMAMHVVTALIVATLLPRLAYSRRSP
jgi:cytochrome bd-type quinol oxidase subunit 2